MLITPGQLNGAKQISFYLKSDKPGPLAFILTEADDSNYQVFFDLPDENWKKLNFALSQFSFDKDTKDENARLDAEQIFRLAVVDISGLTGTLNGPRTISVSELRIELDSPPQTSSAQKTKKTADDSIAEIYTMKIDGSELTRLTYNSYSENHVHISPEKTKLVFTAFTRDLNRDGQVSEADMDSAEIGVMNIDGSDYKLITNNNYADFGAMWGPDGQRILFTTNRFGQFDLATIKSDGTDFKRLTFTSDAFEMDPHWVGQTIVFNRWTPGKEAHPGIWKTNSDGSNMVQLTNPTFPKASKATPFGDMDPKISPDGKKIAFERHQNNRGNFGFGDFDIYVMNIDGSDLKDISQNLIADIMPVWSPDSKQLTYWLISENLKDTLDIFVINADGTGRRKITKEPDNLEEEMPSWLSEQKIVFSGKRAKK
jgi:dipeptidyl aminopeptidase/acylaminoacyl peptidase